MQDPNTRITFYLLQDTEERGRLVFACRLVDKAFGLGHRVHARVASPETAKALDDLLWTFRQGSFIPHGIVGSPEAAAAAVTIGDDNGRTPEADLLINLAPDAPAAFRQFPRIAEIVCGDGEDRARGRDRYRFYRRAGLQPETHELT